MLQEAATFSPYQVHSADPAQGCPAMSRLTTVRPRCDAVVPGAGVAKSLSGWRWGCTGRREHMKACLESRSVEL